MGKRGCSSREGGTKEKWHHGDRQVQRRECRRRGRPRSLSRHRRELPCEEVAEELQGQRTGLGGPASPELGASSAAPRARGNCEREDGRDRPASHRRKEVLPSHHKHRGAPARRIRFHLVEIGTAEPRSLLVLHCDDDWMEGYCLLT